jgi:two-component system OmpR family sensor kinase
LLERQREFVRDASHELRTPITVARGHAELISAENRETQTGEDIAVVLDELDRLERLSERLLVLAAAEHPSFLAVAMVQIEPLVLGTARRWEPTADREWRVDVASDGWIRADAERLAIALDALIENAVKATDEGERIRIAASHTDGSLVIEVADTGVGIDREQLARVFDRFSRIDAARARGRGGTGLGLAIVKAIAEAHGGSVSADGEPDRGATFRMHLPGFRSVRARPEGSRT